MGSEVPKTDDLSIVTLATPSMSGSSNMVLSRIFSKMDLKPRAPVFLDMAFLRFEQ